MNGTIESRLKRLTVGGEEGHCGCSVGVVHGGIPHGGACPPAGGAHGGGGQYPWLKLWPGWPARGSGGQYPPKGGGSHVGGCPAVRDLPHGITVGGPI
jgi:hypothetical protein